MRWLAAALLWLVAAPAAAGPIRVEIRPEGSPRDPFVVSVNGHYADFHNGRSRHWTDVPLRAGPRRFIPLGPVNVLLNMGVSVAVQHPEYVTEWTRSDRTPLLLRPVGFETFRPRRWRSVLETDDPFDNGGPAYLLGQVEGHFQMFLGRWLPLIDAAEEDLRASDESVRGYRSLFEELARRAMTDDAARRPAHLVRSLEDDPVFARNLTVHDAEQRADVRDLLYRIRQWVSVPRAERVAIRGMMDALRTGRGVSADLMTDADRARIADLLARYAADVDAGRTPEPLASWANPETRVEYRVRVEDTPRPCANVGVRADLTGVVHADLGDMTNRVTTRFCRDASGRFEDRT